MDKKNSEKTADHSTESVFGRVTDCLNLNVRAEPDPNAAINCTILKRDKSCCRYGRVYESLVQNLHRVRHRRVLYEAIHCHREIEG